jgi:predicted DNA-binding protein (MmcQ/YjbR family)
MTADELRAFCLGLAGAEETFPFNASTSVFKAGGKVFAISALSDEPLDVSVKCDPDEAEELRETHDSIVPGYHLNKRHWITVTLGADASDDLVGELIADSHGLVTRPRGSTPRARRAR